MTAPRTTSTADTRVVVSAGCGNDRAPAGWRPEYTITSMIGPPDVAPFTRTEILDALEGVEREVASFFASLSSDELTLRVGEAWTPAEHLQHLCIVVAAVARG